MSKNKDSKTRKPLSIRVYAELCWKRYGGMSKKKKIEFLDELSSDCQVSRQHAKRLMGESVKTEGFSKNGAVSKGQRGRKPVYANDDELVRWLQDFWRQLNFPNTKVFPVMLAEWLPYFEDNELAQPTREKILKMSSSTMEKLLRSYKREHGKKHFAATKNKGRLKKMFIRVPERKLDFEITTSGYLEGDTVAHCGDSLQGRHGWTLNSCCIHTSWTESEAFLGKEQESIVASMIEMRGRFPFPVKGYHTDCGSEFLNDQVCTYLEDPQHYVVQTHGRAYKKNDQARVEQSNWTQVRQSFGYDRVEEQKVIDCMNDIYRNELRVLRNFFTPGLKQKSKIRVGSKYKRKFHLPQTPFERVMADAGVSQNVKDKLVAEKANYNPFEIKKARDQKLKFFEKLLQNQSKSSESNQAHNGATKEAA